MMKLKNIKKRLCAMTLMEVLIVVSLVSAVCLAIYSSLANGIKVWERSQKLIIEEDIAIFFEKINRDLQNVYQYSLIDFKGNNRNFSFPTMIKFLPDKRSQFNDQQFIEQMGKVEYYFDGISRNLYKRQASYGQALNQKFGDPRVIISNIDDIIFKYVYVTEAGEFFSDQILEVLPMGVVVEVHFLDDEEKRVLRKIMDIPVNI